MLSEVFLSFLVSSVIACFLALGSQLYKSKCDKIELGCIKIHRAVELETDIEQPKIELPTFNQIRTPSLDKTVHGKT